jgi:hypothetical protein
MILNSNSIKMPACGIPLAPTALLKEFLLEVITCCSYPSMGIQISQNI